MQNLFVDLVYGLSSDERAKLNEFMLETNSDSAQKLYDAMPDGVKKVAEVAMIVADYHILPNTGSVNPMVGIKGKGNKGNKGNEPKNTSTPNGSSSDHKIIEIKSGGKGEWNKQLNKPEPNTVYKVDGNNTYKTDSQGRVQSVEAKLSLNKNDRNSYQQCKAGKCGVAGDEGGHLIGTRFNEPGEKINIVPMNSNLNRVEWKKMENLWAKALKENKQVDVKIEPVYIGNSDRPAKFNVRYTIEGERPVIKNFNDAQGGN
ncbi:DNA/RNA non-specific endonuclease [Providencia rettgeri]|uniref:DNA/RNA non-specific endonuclease n=1 Tax=Providencia rettgeri TaxID=587 RepID=UPI0034E07862